MQTIAELQGRHQGEDIFIICPGTSLKGFDFTKLDGYITFAINDVIFHYPATYHLYNDCMMTCQRYHPDIKVWHQAVNWAKSAAAAFGRLCSRTKDWTYAAETSVVCRHESYHHNVGAWKAAGNTIWQRFYVYDRVGDMNSRLGSRQLWVKKTSAMPAIQLAWRMGAERIYLLGFDCCRRDGFRYFYEKGCPDMPGGKRDRGQAQLHDGIEDMQNLRLRLERNHHFDPNKIINLSPITECGIWPRLRAKEWMV